ncbi:MAG: ABC transporter ATP-binding protein [Anaerolineae bacterium]|nr:ABC transporter ATP-binding protein [Anaerolineae bacterium]
MGRLLGFLVPHKKLLIALIIVNLVLSAMLTVAPLVIKAIVDDVIGQQQLHLLLPYLALLLAVAAGRAVTTYFYTYGQNRLGQLVMTDVRLALYRRLLALPYGFYDRERTGRLISRVGSDVESTRIFLSQIMIESMSHLMTITLATMVMLQQDHVLALISLGPMVISGLGMFFAHRKLRPYQAISQENMARLSANLQDSLAGIKVVKAFAQEAQEQAKFDTVALQVRDGNLQVQDTWSKRWAVIGSLGRFMQLALIGVGGLRVMNDEMTLGTLIAVISLSMLLLGAVNALGTQLNAFSQTSTAAVRIFELLDEPVTIQSPAPRASAPQGPPTVTRGDVDFDDVSFAYPTSNAKALHEVTLHVPAGGSLAIVGETGSGKSTLVHLMGRFYDVTSGCVRVDGRDVRDYDLAELRRHIGMVAQDTLLFSASIAENIAFGRPDASQAEIERAARLAQAHEFIVKLPGGYNTVVGERGTGLSGGQRQRVAIARAILLDPKILILDDSMSAVDAQTEKLLQAAIQEVMQGRTTILIAHRLSTVEKADHIIVLKSGRIIEQGPHEALLRHSGYYRHVLELQQMSGASIPDTPTLRPALGDA